MGTEPGTSLTLSQLSPVRNERSEVTHEARCGSLFKVKQELKTESRSLLQRRRRIIRQLVLARVRPLHFQFIEEQRRTDNRRWHG
jgi:hypothetical protein